MWSIISWDFFLLSLVFIRIVPLRRPRTSVRSHLDSFYHHSHRIRTRPLVRLGTVRAGSSATRAGVYLGSLLISTPGGALRPGSQAGLRRLIVGPDRVSAGGLAKNLPAQVAFSLTREGCYSLWVVACAGGRSSVRAVTRTAGIRLTMFGAFRLYFNCKGHLSVCM